MSDIIDAVGRMREMNAALSDWDRIREEGERISREEAYKVLALEIATLRAEIERLRLTEEEREAIGWAIAATAGVSLRAETMRGLLERTQFAIREPDSPQAIAKCDTTPHPPSTPAVCTVPPQCTEDVEK